jgi:hypothetical protein
MIDDHEGWESGEGWSEPAQSEPAGLIGDGLEHWAGRQLDAGPGNDGYLDDGHGDAGQLGDGQVPGGHPSDGGDHPGLPPGDDHDPTGYPYQHGPGSPGDHSFAAGPAGPAEPAEPADPAAADPGGHDVHAGSGPAAEPGESVVDGSGPAAPPQPVDAMSFPPLLDLDVTPSDGQPWVDPGLLGTDVAGLAEPGGDPASGLALDPPADPPAALLADLHAADGGAGPATSGALAESGDPAIRALAAYWGR